MKFAFQQFQGNFDNNTVVHHYVPRPTMVDAVYVIPKERNNNFAIRLELYGCIFRGEYAINLGAYH